MSDPAVPTVDPPATIGRYTVVGRLASGGMAEVLLARATSIGGFERPFVIKRMHPEVVGQDVTVKSFMDEARLSASLQHPNIVQVIDVDQDRGDVYMVLEFLHGRDLLAVLREAAKRRTRVPLPLAAYIVQAICRALHYAHTRVDASGQPLGIVHRDISPQNVVVTFEGEVKVIDFGIAKASSRLGGGTRSGVIKGKLGYMSPEQCRGKPLDCRTDVFAVGILLYELTVGRRLFVGQDDFETLRIVVECNVAPPSSIVAGYDPALERIVMRALAADRDRRYPTAEALLEDLERWHKSQGHAVAGIDLARYMRQQFADVLSAWEAARGDPIKELEALRAKARSASDAPVEPRSDPTPPTIEKRTMTLTLGAGESVASARPRRRALRLALVGTTAVLAIAVLVFAMSRSVASQPESGGASAGDAAPFAGDAELATPPHTEADGAISVDAPVAVDAASSLDASTAKQPRKGGQTRPRGASTHVAPDLGGGDTTSPPTAVPVDAGRPPLPEGM